MAGDESTNSGMPGRYANALFELAENDGSLDRVAGELERFQALLDASSDLDRLVRSPVFGAEDQARALGAVLERAGVTGLTANFLGLVARNRRLFAVRQMIKDFRTQLARHRGEISAEVTSAVPLNDEQMGALRETLRASLGKDVQVTTNVNSELIGGLIVKVGSRMIDSSIRTKLNALRVAMKEVG
ncbi:MAG: F0F1 ATP synthase subunit delta [Rhizobiales bacterium]|nr:F0F1 ATP synthase subunit delta [Hyphomicrobiales bacterium]